MNLTIVQEYLKQKAKTFENEEPERAEEELYWSQLLVGRRIVTDDEENAQVWRELDAEYKRNQLYHDIGFIEQ